MSFLSAALVSAALLGAGPEVVTSEEPVTEVQQIPHDSAISIPGEQGTIAAYGTPGGACETYAASGCYPNTVCCDETVYCEADDGCRWCCLCCLCGGDDCEPGCWDRHLLNYCVGPGDMHPHYPYFPVYHGYYYFRPYYWQHVFEDAATVARMGGDPRAPYSVEFLKASFPPAPIEPLPVAVRRDQLPLLEDLLLPGGPPVPPGPPIPPGSIPGAPLPGGPIPGGLIPDGPIPGGPPAPPQSIPAPAPSAPGAN